MPQKRLQKIIAQAGLASRREAERMILAGRVSVNNLVTRQLGTRADGEQDEIRVDGMLIHPESEKVYLMLNKPRGYVTTLYDPRQRPIVMDLLSDVPERIFPVGRLDYDSQGLIFMTNDGDFAQKLLHPRFRVPKVYRVKIKGSLSKGDIRALNQGIELEDGKFLPEEISVSKINEKSSWLLLTLREGKNRIIRRAFHSIEHDVSEIIRIRIGNIELGDLGTGRHRLLTKAEIGKLSSLSQNSL